MTDIEKQILIRLALVALILWSSGLVQDFSITLRRYVSKIRIRRSTDSGFDNLKK